MHLLGCLLIAVLVIVLTVIGIGLTILQKALQAMGINISFLKLFGNKTAFRSTQNNGSTPPPAQSQEKKKEKLFTKDDGEYVDFEEVKE